MTVIEAICSGPGHPLANGKRSGIAKQPLSGAVIIGERGIASDVQVNRKYHGFPAMALHQFPFEHHAWLTETFGPLIPLGQPGGMGENLSASGLMEENVFIGDRFRFGSALIEVTQPRQPCATIEQHLQTKGVVKAMVAAARSGWFYRVIKTGAAEAGDTLQLVERPQTIWSVRRAFEAVYGRRSAAEPELRELAALPRVSDRLVRDIAKRAAL